VTNKNKIIKQQLHSLKETLTKANISDNKDSVCPVRNKGTILWPTSLRSWYISSAYQQLSLFTTDSAHQAFIDADLWASTSVVSELAGIHRGQISNGRWRLSSSPVVVCSTRICNVTQLGAARDGGPVVLRSVRATPCLSYFPYQWPLLQLHRVTILLCNKLSLTSGRNVKEQEKGEKVAAL